MGSRMPRPRHAMRLACMTRNTGRNIVEKYVPQQTLFISVKAILIDLARPCSAYSPPALVSSPSAAGYQMLSARRQDVAARTPRKVVGQTHAYRKLIASLMELLPPALTLVMAYKTRTFYSNQLLTNSTKPPDFQILIMCQAECFGNYHRKCKHYIKLYESGVIEDCNSPNCGVSKAHQHTGGRTRNCTCPKVYQEKRRVLNLIQDWCDPCREAAWATLDRDNGREW